MIRLFDTHKTRKFIELEGSWDFTPIDESSDFSTNLIYKYKLPVPGCWEMHPDFLTYRGKGVYRRFIFVEKKGALQLTFKGVSHTADVYLDGKKIGHHYNAYTPFSVVVPIVEIGEHELAVMVDNSFSEISALHIPNDYYTYGGLIRPVVVENIPQVFINKIHFTPILVDNAWRANIKIYINNIGACDEKINLIAALGDQIVDFGNVISAKGKCIVLEKDILFNNVKPWSHNNPNLYLLKAQLIDNDGLVFDDLIERVGFRTVVVKDGKIVINGEEIFLKGFNRHEDHPMVGAAIPYILMVKDIELIQESGANAVRTSHYPNDEKFLDLCDERGIYVWEENHARGLSLESMQNPNFELQCEDCIREMVENHYNHPGIIIWGILNECASNTVEGKRMYKKQFDQIASMDESRPLTFASCHHHSDICHDLTDIASINIYAGWYEDISAAQKYDSVEKWIDTAGGKGKPIIVSEFGGDAFYGYRDPSRVRGTEERLCDILDDNLSAFYNRERIAGVFVWQFCDCRTHDGVGWFVSRGRSKNNKGIVDEYRRPKLAYSTVQKYFKSNLR